MDWREEYRMKLRTAEEAARLIKSGERVAIGGSTDQPRIMQEALFARRDELKNVEVMITPMLTNTLWLQPGYDDSFNVALGGWTGPLGRPLILEKRGDGLIPNSYYGTFIKSGERPAESKHTDFDWFLMKVSPPNEQGVVSVGAFRWMKKELAKKSKMIIAEVDSSQYWVHGDTTMSVSEIDCFVEYTDPLTTMSGVEEALASVDDEAMRQQIRALAEQAVPYARAILVPALIAAPQLVMGLAESALGLKAPEGTEAIAGHVAELIRDGDTIQLGEGAPSGYFGRMGIFDNKHDLGVHSEIGCRGLGKLIEGGVITGRYKTVHPGKAIFQGLDAIGPEELEYCVENPDVEVYGVEHVADVKLISALDNFVSMNNALSVDLTGQICFESIFGGIPMHGPGGQPDFHMGAFYSKGGRAISVLYSTAADGSMSRIVPQFDVGTVVSIPRSHADYIVTEFGVAKLVGKSFRERAEELISIAHPDFRAELRKEAQKLFWP